MTLTALQLLLLDSRAPAGAHAHSSGMEPAVTAGLVHDLADVEEFCRARLRTTGRVNAAFAAAACHLAELSVCRDALTSRHTDNFGSWDELDAEYEARLPAQALRTASRQLGNGLRRLLRTMFPDVALPWTGPPHHPIALGLGVALAGGDAALAAEAAALATVSAPASAAVRLLGLDPLAVYAMLGRLTATDSGSLAPDSGASEPLFASQHGAALPADSAPFLDLLADVHHTAEVRLFAS